MRSRRRVSMPEDDRRRRRAACATMTPTSGPIARADDHLAVGDRDLVVCVLVHPQREPRLVGVGDLDQRARTAAEVLLAPPDEHRPRIVEAVGRGRGASANRAVGERRGVTERARIETHGSRARCRRSRRATVGVAVDRHRAATLGHVELELADDRPAVDPVDGHEERLAAEHVAPGVMPRGRTPSSTIHHDPSGASTRSPCPVFWTGGRCCGGSGSGWPGSSPTARSATGRGRSRPRGRARCRPRR